MGHGPWTTAFAVPQDQLHAGIHAHPFGFLVLLADASISYALVVRPRLVRWAPPRRNSLSPSPGAYVAGLWGFLLKELPGGRTRLVVSGYQTGAFLPVLRSVSHAGWRRTVQPPTPCADPPEAVDIPDGWSLKTLSCQPQ